MQSRERRGYRAKRSHNLKVVSSNLAPATNKPLKSHDDFKGFPFGAHQAGNVTLFQLENG